MTLDEAKALLVTLYRDELVDHTFGDAEVYWSFNRGDDTPKAEGYFGRDYLRGAHLRRTRRGYFALYRRRRT